MTTKTENKKLTDVLRWEVDNGIPGYCRDEAFIKNTLGQSTTLTDPCGYPLKNTGTAGTYELCAAGDEGTCDALLLATEDFEALANNGTTTKKYPILVRGPAIIAKAGLPTSDQDSPVVAFTLATLITQLLTLGIVTHVEPTKTQSTSP